MGKKGGASTNKNKQDEIKKKKMWESPPPLFPNHCRLLTEYDRLVLEKCGDLRKEKKERVLLSRKWKHVQHCILSQRACKTPHKIYSKLGSNHKLHLINT